MIIVLVGVTRKTFAVFKCEIYFSKCVHWNCGQVKRYESWLLALLPIIESVSLPKFGLYKWILIKSFLLPTFEQPASQPVFPPATHTVSEDKVSRIQNWFCVICIRSGTQLTFVWFMNFGWFPYRHHFERTNWGLCSSGTNMINDQWEIDKFMR